MSESVKRPTPLKPDVVPADKMLVTLTAGELRLIVGEILDERLKRMNAGRGNGLLNAEQAAEFLGYSQDWVYKNWQKIGGKKIGGKGVRFDSLDLEAWVKSRSD